MKTLLINPPSERIIEAWDKPDFPHLGLAYLAAFLREKGVEVGIIDAKFESLNLQQVIEKARQFSPQIIGLTAMTNYVKAAAYTAEALKEEFRESIFLIGGAHPTALPTDTLKEFSVFDIAVVGEGEETLSEIAQAKDKQWQLIQGIAYKKDKEVTQNALRNRIADLDSLPFPAWDILPVAKTYPLITSRGCPFRCVFCMRMHGEKIRLRSPNNVAQEASLLQEKYNVRHIPILDELFTISQERVKALCDSFNEAGLEKITWGVNSRVTGVSFEMFKRMRQAGCRKIDFGIESGNNEILKKIKKGITTEDAVNAVKLAKKARIKTHGLFIIGHPFETKKTIQDTINLAVKLNTAYVSVGIMVPYPGTEVFEMARRGEAGYKIISYDWDDYNKQIGNALELENLDRKTLERMQVVFYLKFYLSNLRLFSFFKFLFSYRRGIYFYIKNKLLRRK